MNRDYVLDNLESSIVELVNFQEELSKDSLSVVVESYIITLAHDVESEALHSPTFAMGLAMGAKTSLDTMNLPAYLTFKDRDMFKDMVKQIHNTCAKVGKDVEAQLAELTGLKDLEGKVFVADVKDGKIVGVRKLG